MLPLCSFLVRSPTLSRSFSTTPPVSSTVKALIYQGSVHGSDLQVFFPDYGLVVTRDGLVDSDKPLNRISLPLNESTTYEVETDVFERQLSEKNVHSFIQRVKERSKKIEEIDKESDKIRKRLRELENTRVRVKQRNDVQNFLDNFGTVRTGLQKRTILPIPIR